MEQHFGAPIGLKVGSGAVINIDVNENAEESVREDAVLSYSSFPANTTWEGRYGLTISFCPTYTESTSKTMSTYSKIKDKLYVKMGSACPVQFHTKKLPPPGSFIRAMAIYSKPGDMVEPVTRCLIHSNPNETMNIGHPAPSHLIRCDDPNSVYADSTVTQRQSVITPYISPEVGMQYTTYIYRFMCLGSCISGLNRRPIQVIFSLENGNECLGRRVMDVRICACPGRDRLHEEMRSSPPEQLKKLSCMKRAITRLAASSGYHNNSSPKKRLDEEIFILQVRGKHNYELLEKIRDGLELADLATPEQVAAYKRMASSHSSSLHQDQPNAVNGCGSEEESKVTSDSSPSDVNIPNVSRQRTSVPSLNKRLRHTMRPMPSRVEKTSRNCPTSSPRVRKTSYNQPMASRHIKDTPRKRPLPSSADLFRKHPTVRLERLHISSFDRLSLPNPPSLSQNEALTLTPSPVPSPYMVEMSCNEPVVSWLDSIGMISYVEQFKPRGYTTVDDLQHLKLSELDEMNMSEEDRALIWTAVCSLYPECM